MSSLTYQIREFKSDDLTAVVELWNQNVPEHLITEPVMREKTLGDKDFDPNLTWVAMVDEHLIAFMQGISRLNETGERIGWIKLFCVATAYRRNGIGSTLLQTIESGLVTSSVSRIQLMDSNPNYFLPGLDPFCTEAVAFFERKGYEKFDDTSNLIANLSQDLTTAAEEEQLHQRGIVIRRALPQDRFCTAAFIQSNWPSWVPEVDAAFDQSPIILHLALENDILFAFSASDVNNRGMAWFGPMGTDQRFRGRGVGAVLLKRCLQDLKNQGHDAAIIPWVGPIPFYMHHVGAKVKDIFWRYKKEIQKA